MVSESSVQFNEGCDGRLAGLPLSSNPYNISSWEGQKWEHGWLDVDRNWGREVGQFSKGSIRSLPPIRY